MFTFQITCNSVEDMERILAALKHSADPAVVHQVQTAVDAAPAVDAAQPTEHQADAPTRRGPGRPRREKASNDTAAPVAESGSEAVAASTEQKTGEPSVQPEPQSPTLDDARAALRDLTARKGEDDMVTALAVLEKFNATRISEVKAENYPEFIEACKAA